MTTEPTSVSFDRARLRELAESVHPDALVGLHPHEALALLDALEAAERHVAALREAAKAVHDHYETIGWYDGFDGTTRGTDYHLTQMTVEDEEEMSRRMDALAAALSAPVQRVEGEG